MQPATAFADASEVRNMIRLKGYFKGSSNLLNHALESVMHPDISLSALSELISYLSRLMVSLHVHCL